jgi:hypothetical protein
MARRVEVQCSGCDSRCQAEIVPGKVTVAEGWDIWMLDETEMVFYTCSDACGDKLLQAIACVTPVRPVPYSST